MNPTGSIKVTMFASSTYKQDLPSPESGTYREGCLLRGERYRKVRLTLEEGLAFA